MVNAPEQTIARYGDLLAAGDVDAIAGLYAPGAEIVPEGLPSLSGEAAIREFYEETFKTLRIEGVLTVTSAITTAELSVVRCEEPGRVFLLADGSSRDSWFRELFVLTDVDGEWRILKYMFSENPQQSQ